MTGFWFGLAAGVFSSILFAAMFARHWARRVRRVEQRARASERRAEQGHMTGGLAHEVKNPLSTINMNIDLLREDIYELAADSNQARHEVLSDQRPGRIIRRFEKLSQEIQRIKDILEDFLQFAGRIRLDRKPVNVSDLIDQMCDFFLPQAQAAYVHLRTQFDARHTDIRIDPALLKQAILNLMINACRAMSDARHTDAPSGGNDELIIRTQQRRGRDLGDELQIHVIDTGPGMDEQTVKQIFHPYFSGKKGGSGLGLPIARRIIEEHGGHISCYSEPGRGTEFVITLPHLQDGHSSNEPRP